MELVVVRNPGFQRRPHYTLLESGFVETCDTRRNKRVSNLSEKFCIEKKLEAPSRLKKVGPPRNKR